MKKALVIISLAALLLAPLSLMGCGGGTTLTDNDLATIRGLLNRMDNAETDIANRPTTEKVQEMLDDKVAPDLSGYVTLEQYNTLLAKYNTLMDAADPNSLISRLAKLENNQSSDSGSSTPSTTGEVAVTIKEAPFWVFTTTTQTTPAQFTVHIENKTTSIQYVNWSVAMLCQTPTGAVTGSPTLTRFTYPVTYTVTLIPALPANTTQVLFTPNANSSFAVGAGATIDIVCMLALTTGAAEQWSINLIPVYSTTWF